MFTCYVSPFGQAKVYEQLPTQSGFEVWRAEINGTPVALKSFPSTFGVKRYGGQLLQGLRRVFIEEVGH